ncbi:unnamed protein product, partial [Mesorhabditis belari]|uniref:K Homology domain-containing protein n=1 Tax=Mesorhabditis belari TaxID=2138241 RepID=A0AAF3F7R1_9BILA
MLSTRQSMHYPKLPLSPSLLVQPSRSHEDGSPSAKSGTSTKSSLQTTSPKKPGSGIRPCSSSSDFGKCEGGMEYFAELLKEKKHLTMFPSLFPNVERILEDEISRVRAQIFQTDFVQGELALPEAVGEIVTITEKLYVPKNDYPDYNFVGRILGPRGMTAKQLEQETGCKIMVRGRGSMRDRRKEDSNRGKPNWEHLEDELHVLIQCEDTENRARIKLSNASKIVRKLLTPPEGTDDFKRKQLMELAIINGTYKPHKTGSIYMNTRMMTPIYPMSPMRPLLMSPQPSPSPITLPAMPQSPAFVSSSSHEYKLHPSVYEAFSLPVPMEARQQQPQSAMPPLTPMSGFSNYFNPMSLHGGPFFHDSHLLGQQI